MVIIDEVYSLMGNKCGDFIVLVLVRLEILVLGFLCIGLFVMVVEFVLIVSWLGFIGDFVDIVKVEE